MRLRTKISLVFTLLTAAIIFLLSSFVYVVSLQHTHGYFFTRLKVRASMSAESHFESNNANATRVQEFRQRHLQQLPQEKEYFFANDSSARAIIAKTLPEIPAEFIDNLRRTGAAEYNRGFQHYSGLVYNAASGSHIVIAAAYDENGENQMDFLRNLKLVVWAVSCLLVFATGQVFARRIMQPIRAIITKVHGINASNLSERLAENDGSDELAEMARTFNYMLDRLETTFELQSNFISNASHELRTPLTTILGEAEVTLQSQRSPQQYIDAINAMHYEAKKLEEVTASLLKLSQISFDGKKQKIEPVLLDELLMTIKVSFDKRLPGNQVKVLLPHDDYAPDVYMLMGIRVWVELALTNIIQNSIKYSDNKEVLITLSASNEHFFIHISDSGIGIPQDEIQHIFEPFFRASNTTKYVGHGIGLPLASRIIRLHGGQISIHSKSGAGTKVSVQFSRHGDIKN